jgi:intein/homing endonuclease
MTITAQAAGRLGAFRRNFLHGNPGTEETRRKGGVASYLNLRANPELAAKLGFKLEKSISFPDKGPLLSEFVGIVLGDGSICSDYQVRIYFNAKTDSLYIDFVRDMVFQLFAIDSTIALRPKNTLELVISSRGVVRFLFELGLVKGNKIRNQIDIPSWIFEKPDHVKACLRGLMDTDGGVYFHTHTTKGIKYRNLVLCFTSRSEPLLDSVERMFLSIGIKAKNNATERVFVYSGLDIERYMDIVGSHSANFIKRFKSYKNTRV